MVFKYLGTYTRLAQEVEESKDIINNKYRKILGDQNYKKLEETVNRILVSKSFINSREEWNSKLSQKLPEDASNSFIVACPKSGTLQLDEKGKVKDRKIRTSPLFYISKEGFENSTSREFTDKPIASYIHEFDHFLTYALQKVPLYIATLILFNKVKPTNTSASFAEFVKEIAPLPPGPEKYQRGVLGLQAFSLQEFYEKSNRILDQQILSSIGIKTELSWRGMPRKSVNYFLPPNQMLIYACEGDPFRTLTDKEAITRSLDWQRNMNPSNRTEFYINFLNSLCQTKISKVPITELTGKNTRKKKKKQPK